MRADLYSEALNSIDSATVEGSRCIIFPSTFTVRDRYMNKTCQNTMALVQIFNKPTFFKCDIQLAVAWNSKLNSQQSNHTWKARFIM